MIDHLFTRMATRIAEWAGSPWAFGLALGAVVIWALLGPVSGYSEIWQLAINTGTTIVTFLVVFVIQNSQNRDTRALQVKIDALIVATKGASNALIDIENSSAAEIEALHQRYRAISARAKELGYDLESKLPFELVVAEKAAANGKPRQAGRRPRARSRASRKPAQAAR